MASLENTSILSLFCILVLMSIVVICICILQKQRSAIPTNWPLLGMMPGVVYNAHRIHDYMVDISVHTDGTFMWKGPCFTRLGMLFTTNPLDIHHILSKNFGNYPKGDKFHKIFDILGDGILNSDGELWEINRKVTMSILKHPGFQNMLETIIWDKVEKGLLPILESISGHGAEIDLQDIFQRFTFDTICKVLFDDDPESLSLDFPYIPSRNALSVFEEVVFFRHITPPCLWKLQQFLRVGKEKQFIAAQKILDEFIYKCIFRKQNEYNSMKHELQEEKFVLLTTLMNYIKDQSCTSRDPTKHLRDILLDLMVAGKDTTSSALSWFFFNLAKNPLVIDKILEEIHKYLDVKMGKRWNAKELGEMVYLHGALCESLRLFPPVPFNHKSTLRPENLPNGRHKVDQNIRIILPLYTMGRMKSVWGEDCMEFNPERWISKTGGIKHEPSYKFVTFGAGPRSCVGKDMALCQLKIVAATIICRYHIELVEGYPVVPANAIILHMKHGLKVRLTKRSELS